MKKPEEEIQEQVIQGALLVEYTQFPGNEFNAAEIKAITGQNYDYGCWLDGLAFLVAVERNASGLIEKASLDVLNSPEIIFRSGPKSTEYAPVGLYAENSANKIKK
jgi:hypothetical protein